MELLAAYDWPGNVGELSHAIRRAVVLCGSGELSPQHFPALATSPNRPRALAARDLQAALPAGVAVQEQAQGEPINAAARIADRPNFARYGLARLLDERGEMRPIGALEEEVIRFAIGHYRGRMSEVARRLGNRPFDAVSKNEGLWDRVRGARRFLRTRRFVLT